MNVDSVDIFAWIEPTKAMVWATTNSIYCRIRNDLKKWKLNMLLFLSNFLFYVTLEFFVCISFHLIWFDSIRSGVSIHSVFFVLRFVLHESFVPMKILISKYYLVWSVFSHPYDKSNEAIERRILAKEYGMSNSNNNKIYGHFMWIDKFRSVKWVLWMVKKTNVIHFERKKTNTNCRRN